jgi:signal transduction histidine kinase
MPDRELVSQLQGTLGKLELVLGTIAEAIVWTDEAGTIQWCNASFDRLAGRPHLAILGGLFTEMLPLERDGRRVTSVHELLDAALSPEDGVRVYERRGPSGRMLIEISVSTTAPGDVPSIVLVLALRDVTEKKIAEAAIDAKNRELETLIQVISHDLREPLRAIENFSALVQKEQTGRLSLEGDDYLSRIVRASARMRSLLDDIVKLARARKIDPPSEKIDFGVVADEVLSRLADEIARSGASVRVIAPLPRLKVNKEWATQALYNLVGNALKFTREGRKPDIEISAYRAGAAIPGVSVLDRGPGVNPEDAERIFQLFWRAVGREVEGTGAGLAIVRAVAERHGGRAWVRPRDGGGSEFIITFGNAA